MSKILNESLKHFLNFCETIFNSNFIQRLYQLNRGLHKSFTYIKLASLIILFIGFSWVVYADGRNDLFQNNTPVKIVRCYPNPATSFVNFDFQKNIDNNYSLQVFSFSGKKMIETPVSNSKIIVTLTDFYRGIYVYQLHDKAGKLIESGKFQVVK